MGFFWDPKSRDFWDFFPKKIPNQKSRDFLGFLGLGFFFEWDPKIPKNPKLFPVKDLNFSDFLKRKTKQKIPSSIHQFRYFWTKIRKIRGSIMEIFRYKIEWIPRNC